MEKFKVGDRAIFVGSAIKQMQPKLREFIGSEVIITYPLGSWINPFKEPCYGIRFKNGKEAWVVEDSLEPLQKRPELGSLDEI